MCDLGHFKRFNDTFGHEGGDVLPIEFARLLRGSVRAEDIVCRYGGEELLLILPEADESDARRRAEAILQAVRRLHVHYQGQPLGHVTTSIGLAVFPQHGALPELLCQTADRALYRARQEDRDRICSEPAPSLVQCLYLARDAMPKGCGY